MIELNCNANLIYDLHHGAVTGNVGLVKFALDHDTPIDCVVNGLMPLHVACISDNNLATVQYLIDRGAQVNAQRWHKKDAMDKSQPTGSTALHVACANGCTRITDLLLRNGASVSLKDKYGSTPIDVATVKGCHVDMIRKLHEAATAPWLCCSRMDKPLPIPGQPASRNNIVLPSLPQPQLQSCDLFDRSSPSSQSSSSVSASSDNDWYGIGIVNTYAEGEQYIKVLERRLSASLDDPYPNNHPPLDAVAVTTTAASKCAPANGCHDKKNYSWHRSTHALKMSLHSLNRASRNSVDVLSKKSDYDMITPAIAAVTTTSTVTSVAAAPTTAPTDRNKRRSLRSSELGRRFFWLWRKSRPLPVG